MPHGISDDVSVLVDFVDELVDRRRSILHVSLGSSVSEGKRERDQKGTREEETRGGSARGKTTKTLIGPIAKDLDRGIIESPIFKTSGGSTSIMDC